MALNSTTRQAAFSISTLGIGTHYIKAIYSGDGNDNGSTSSSVTETIISLLPSGFKSSEEQGGTDAAVEELVDGRPVVGEAEVGLVVRGSAIPLAEREDYVDRAFAILGNSGDGASMEFIDDRGSELPSVAYGLMLPAAMMVELSREREARRRALVLR